MTMALVVITGCAEAVARLAHVPVHRVEQASYIGWAQPDPGLGWRTRPGVFPSHESGHVPMTFWPDGSRATAPMPAPGPVQTTDEVIIVGCSFAEGYSVRDDEVFAWKLQQRFPKLRFRDFAVPGYGTYQSLLMLQRLLGGTAEQPGARPKLVIYGFLPTHAERSVLTYPTLNALRGFGGERFSPPHVEIHNGELARYAPSVVPDWPFEGDSAAVTLLHSSFLRAKLAGREQYEIPATRILMRHMQEAANRAGSHLLVATLWADGPPGPRENQQMRENMRLDGIEEMDVTYRGPERDPRKLQVGGNGHPGAVVHQWWADRIGDWIAAHAGAF